MPRLKSPRPRPWRRGRSSVQTHNDAELAPRVLALPECPRSELEAEWRRLWGSEVPRHASRALLVRAVAYGLQAEVYGGLDAHSLRLLKKAGQANGKPSRLPPPRLSKGSKLFREWHGETHEVLVLDKGFAWGGETYSSLSAIARAITGTNWNGWAFFGLRPRTKEALADG
jgi:DUF2924 family protein